MSSQCQPAAAAGRMLPKLWTLVVVLVGTAGIMVETSLIKNVNILTESFNFAPYCHTNDTELQSIRHDQNLAGYFRPDRIFGHLHFAKTAGTDVNGQLATRYERICGNKGYSYDSFQFNKRLQKKALSQKGPLDLDAGGPDVISHFQEEYNRGRVPWVVMKEIGFEDCDYVSIERPWYDWKNITKLWPVELHVPCREPLEHLMSQCNYLKHRFNCRASNLVQEVRNCFVHEERFSAKLTTVENLTMKCFKAAPVEPYLEYMDQFLQKRRFPTTYIHRKTNEHRDRTKECIWKDQSLADTVLAILLSHDYYRWCNKCIGSSDDLLRPS